MFIRRTKRPVFVTLPDGSQLTRSELPPPGIRRWGSGDRRRLRDRRDHAPDAGWDQRADGRRDRRSGLTFRRSLGPS
jgi:Protein of unknown function (DUF1153)